MTWRLEILNIARNRMAARYQLAFQSKKNVNFVFSQRPKGSTGIFGKARGCAARWYVIGVNSYADGILGAIIFLVRYESGSLTHSGNSNGQRPLRGRRSVECEPNDMDHDCLFGYGSSVLVMA
ncbi:hypothetical protein EVAR_67843_1 [Eumeta japonica]|uniref:Uncharacterized protein n=1 Tax=Eumeta variegata TaxID=151549 RepID=A0A4C2AEM2_EUMVA|nr:hypothetical protein EVAR_67843_1 [Eumeta japonica]